MERAQEGAWVCAKEAAVTVVVLVPGPTDFVSAQIVVKKCQVRISYNSPKATGCLSRMWRKV